MMCISSPTASAIVRYRCMKHATLRKSFEDYRALRRNRLGGVLTLALKNLRKVGQLLP